jgi:hypothetical protein
MLLFLLRRQGMKVRKNIVITVALLFTVVLLFTSCATTSSQIAFHEEVIAGDQNDALIYVYRIPSFVGSAVSLPVQVDGKKVAVLKQKAYVVFRVTPGEHEISVGNSATLAWVVNQAVTKKSRTLIAVPKGVYFIRSQAGVSFVVPREDAMQEIGEMKYDMGL